MIDCTTLDLDDDMLAHVLVLSRMHRPPLALTMTEAQRERIIAAIEVVDGHGYEYLGDVPLWVEGDAQPPPRPAPAVEPVVVDLDAAKAQRTAELQSEIREIVDAVVSPDARDRLLLDLLLLARGRPVDSRRLEAADDVIALLSRAETEAEKIKTLVAASGDVKALAVVTVDLSAIKVP